MPEDEWGSPGGQEMFQELFTLLLYSLDGEEIEQPRNAAFRPMNLIWMSPALIDVCFLLLNLFFGHDDDCEKNRISLCHFL